MGNRRQKTKCGRNTRIINTRIIKMNKRETKEM